MSTSDPKAPVEAEICPPWCIARGGESGRCIGDHQGHDREIPLSLVEPDRHEDGGLFGRPMWFPSQLRVYLSMPHGAMLASVNADVGDSVEEHVLTLTSWEARELGQALLELSKLAGAAPVPPEVPASGRGMDTSGWAPIEDQIRKCRQLAERLRSEADELDQAAGWWENAIA
jgi:hypothetical protein